MLSLFLFALTILFTAGHLTYTKEWRACPKRNEIFLSYLLFFNVGIMGLLSAYAHIFMGSATARLIGWQPGSPFQFEVGIANLSFGVLGIIAYWFRGRFWDAVIIGWSIFLLGAFIGHLRDYSLYNNTAPLNIGLFIWFTDLVLPLIAIATLIYIKVRCRNGNKYKNNKNRYE